MSTFRVLLVGGVLALTKVGHAVHGVPESPHTATRAFCDSPREAVQIFLVAVERSELALFQRVLDRSVLKPLRVEYVYDVDGLFPTVTVYSELKEPIAIPGNPDVEIRGVTAVLDHRGNIVDTKAHAYARQGRAK